MSLIQDSEYDFICSQLDVGSNLFDPLATACVQSSIDFHTKDLDNVVFAIPMHAYASDNERGEDSDYVPQTQHLLIVPGSLVDHSDDQAHLIVPETPEIPYSQSNERIIPETSK